MIAGRGEGDTYCHKYDRVCDLITALLSIGPEHTGKFLCEPTSQISGKDILDPTFCINLYLTKLTQQIFGTKYDSWDMRECLDLRNNYSNVFLSMYMMFLTSYIIQ